MAAGADRSEDERLLSRAEEALTEIKVASGLSEPHAAVLAALRIRLRGEAGGSLEELLTAAEDPQEPGLDRLLGERTETAPTFESLLAREDRPPKRSLDDLLGADVNEPEPDR
jgi:hypothetical protein